MRLPLWTALLAAYIIGSVDFAVIVARSRGVDIRSVGSGNPGTSNVLRTLGRGPAAMVLTGDLLKGLIGASFGVLATATPLPNSPVVVAAGFFAVVGHCFPVFYRFRGGKGVATAGGVILFTVPLVAVLLTAIWILVARITKIAAVSSLVVVALTVPLAAWRGMRGLSLGLMAAIAILIVVRHWGNIRRMMRGSEEKVPT